MSEVKTSKLRNTLLLDVPAIILAVILGAILYLFGSLEHLLLMCSFLFLGVLITKYEHKVKRKMGLYEHERSWENVIANGLIPAIAIFISLPAFIGSIVAIMADKFASELGVLGGQPYNLKTLKKADSGTSGCVSVFGTWMSLIGALLIGLVAIFLFPEFNLYHALIFGGIGFIGSVVDSIFGVPEEMGIGNKSTTNIICSITGVILAYLIF